MVKTIILVFLHLAGYILLWSQDKKAFYVGHSLSDQIPDMVKSLSDDHATVGFDWVYQSIPGAPLRWQWERKDAGDYTSIHPHYYGYYDSVSGLPAGDFDILVLTESVPRYWSIIDETYQYADSFFVYAKTHNPGLRVYLYETWHCLLSGTPTGCDYDVDAGTWRQRITDDLPMWESVVDSLNARFHAEDPVCLIPAAQGLARLYDSIQAGGVPGLFSIEGIFEDDIHLNDIGKYFVACVHFATIHETDPAGLTNQLQVWWGGDFTAPSQALAAKFQKIAWETVTQYPNSCFTNLPTFNKEITVGHSQIYVHPNPAGTSISIMHLESGLPYQIYTYIGSPVMSGSAHTIDVQHLPEGLYLIVVAGRPLRFLKL